MHIVLIALAVIVPPLLAQDPKGIASNLVSKDPYVRFSALKEISPKAATPEIVNAAINTLTDSDEKVAKQARATLAALRSVAFEELVARLKKDDGEYALKRKIVYVLGDIGGREASDVLAEDIANGCKDAIVVNLGRIAYPSPAAIRALGEVVRNEDPKMILEAIDSLKKIGPKSIPEFRAILAEKAEDDGFGGLIPTAIVVALGGMGKNPDAADTVLPELKNPNKEVRIKSADALGKIGVVSKAVIDGLKEALSDEVFAVRLASAKAMIKLGKGADTDVKAVLSEEADRKNNGFKE